MKVNLIEPLGIDEELIHQYGQKISELGHEFEYYNNKTDSEEEMIARAEDADILMIANNPLPYNVIKSLERLKLINVAFTGIDHVATDIAHEKGIDKMCIRDRKKSEAISIISSGVISLSMSNR